MKIDHGADEAARHGIARSDKWPHIEKEQLAAHPFCAACGASMAEGTGLQAHHALPFHFVVAFGRPNLELDLRNLITLCETEEGKPGPNHHLLIGHLDDFQSSNLTVMTDAVGIFFGMDSAAIRANADWLTRKSNRLKPLDQMTDEDKANFITLMNDTYPLLPP